MPNASSTVTETVAADVTENETVAASACPSPSGLMLEGETVTAPIGPCTGGVVPSRPPVAGMAWFPAESRAVIVQLAATPGATDAPALVRPSQLHARLEPVPVWLASVAPAASSTLTVQVRDDESVAENLTGYDVSALAAGAKIFGNPLAYASSAMPGSCA